ncbi:hypothetical protein BHE74_00002654 [Ensete ventricosum]|nr:hypothetical protein BHE74_00002654 [Ensete ventricosum]RZR93823.1 hypothetical protein BHM03_00022401 [Ensete ventricosum]
MLARVFVHYDLLFVYIVWLDVVSFQAPIYKQLNEAGNYMTLKHAMRTLLPEIFGEEDPDNKYELREEGTHEAGSSFGDPETISTTRNDVVEEASFGSQRSSEANLIRIQGIEPDLNIPFSWVVNNLKNPDYFLHLCVFLRTSSRQPKAT